MINHLHFLEEGCCNKIYLALKFELGSYGSFIGCSKHLSTLLFYILC